MCDAFKNKFVLRNKWVYKIKRDFNDFIVKFKARWIVRDFEQRKSLNYNEIFVAMIKLMNYKIIFVIVVVNNWELKQMNVITVFYEHIKEEIYMQFSNDFKQKSKMC